MAAGHGAIAPAVHEKAGLLPGRLEKRPCPVVVRPQKRTSAPTETTLGSNFKPFLSAL